MSRECSTYRRQKRGRNGRNVNSAHLRGKWWDLMQECQHLSLALFVDVGQWNWIQDRSTCSGLNRKTIWEKTVVLLCLVKRNCIDFTAFVTNCPAIRIRRINTVAQYSWHPQAVVTSLLFGDEIPSPWIIIAYAPMTIVKQPMQRVSRTFGLWIQNLIT